MADEVSAGFIEDTGDLKFVVRERGTTTMIELEGEWDLASVATAHQAFSRVLDRDPECVVLDLSRLEFIDSSGLQAIIELSQRAAAQEARLVIIRGPRAVQRLFEITGLAARLPLIDQQLADSGESSSRLSGAAGSWPAQPLPSAHPGAHGVGGRP